MPFGGGRYRFTRSMVEGAPSDPGVYALWHHEELIYYGRAAGTVTLQQALMQHLTGQAGTCTREATHYGWEITLYPVAREAELLAEYRTAFNRLPRCNATRG